MCRGTTGTLHRKLVNSPYPDEYKKLDLLYICHTCLKYMMNLDTFVQHCATCKESAKIPGHLTYSKDSIRIHQINGSATTSAHSPIHPQLFCQNLCLLSKLFLDHKTVVLFIVYLLVIIAFIFN